MNQHGITFLEVIVVIAILMIVTAFVAPNISDWRQKRALEADFYAVTSQLDYLKSRTRTINGTGALTCASTSGTGRVLSFQIANNPQSDVVSLSPSFAANVIEDPLAKNSNFNILSGQTQIVSIICNGFRGIFLSSGESGVEGGNGPIDISIEPIAGKNIFGAYRVLLNQHTGFIQRFKWNTYASQWVEIE